VAPERGFFDRRAWAAEPLGTALLMLAIVLAVGLSVAEGSPLADALPGPGARFLAVGVLVAPFVALLATSPLGRASGAHLNPAVTLAFWIGGRLSTRDLTGYIAAQLVGGLAGAAAGRALLPRAAWESIGGTVTHPGVPAAAAFVLEGAMTALLLVVILTFSSNERLARLTPLAIVPVLTAIIWLGSPWTGASINPRGARARRLRSGISRISGSISSPRASRAWRSGSPGV
jgi:aquaporin Z